MEYVRVSYPTVRQVDVDDTPCGNTNDVLCIEAGTHTFGLGQPPDYHPPTFTVTVSDTTPASPMRIIFIPNTIANAPSNQGVDQ